MEHTAHDILEALAHWANGEELVRVLLLTSSQVGTDAARDRFSDFDIIVVVTDTRPFLDEDTWICAYGSPLSTFHDRHLLHGFPIDNRLVLYEDGTKVDYTIWPQALLQRVLREQRLPDALDVGYRVLVDKDQLTTDLKPPTFAAHIPARPTEDEYQALVEEFWWETTYVAKNLWRRELFPAKYSFDSVIKFDLLRRMLEWYVELDRDWSIAPGVMGRKFKERLEPALWTEIEETFVGANVEENWLALFRTAAIFRRVAVAVGTNLKYDYPHALDRRVSDYLRRVRHDADQS